MSDAIEHLTTVQIMATSLAAKLGVTHDAAGRPGARADRGGDVGDASPRGRARAAELAAFRRPNAGERLAVARRRAPRSCQRTRALLDARFIPRCGRRVAELRRIAGALADAPRIHAEPLLGGLSARRGAVSPHERRAQRRSRDDAGGRRVADPLPGRARGIRRRIRRCARTSVRWPRTFDSPFGAAIAVFDWARHATVVFRGGGDAGHALDGRDLDGVEPAAWLRGEQARADESRGAARRERARRGSLRGEQVQVRATSCSGSRSPSRWWRTSLHRWRDIALGAVRAATSAHAADGATLAVAVRAPRRAAARVGERRRAREPRRDVPQPADAPMPSRSADCAERRHAAAGPRRARRTSRNSTSAASRARSSSGWRAAIRGRASPRCSSTSPRTSRAIEMREACGARHSRRRRASIRGRGTASGRGARRSRIASDASIAPSTRAARWRATPRGCEHAPNVLAGPIPAACELLESGTVTGEQLPALYDYLLVRTLAEQVLRERRGARPILRAASTRRGARSSRSSTSAPSRSRASSSRSAPTRRRACAAWATARCRSSRSRASSSTRSRSRAGTSRSARCSGARAARSRRSSRAS